MLINFFKKEPVDFKLKLLVPVLIIFSGILILILFTNYKLPSLKNPKDNVEITQNYPITNAIFHNLNLQQKTEVENTVRKQVRLIVSKPQFKSSLDVVKKHETTISNLATEASIDPKIVLGVALLENGGSESAVSYAGAAGIFQITKGTAKTLGLQVDDQVDERLDPDKNIRAGITYLRQNLQLFSDIGLAVWAYHAGPQNVSRAFKYYLENVGETEAYDYLEAEKSGNLDRAKYVWRSYVTKDNVDVYKLLETPQTKLTLIPLLGDETEYYVYKVLASSIIYESFRNHQNSDLFLQKVESFNQGRMVLADLLDHTNINNR